MALFFDSAWFDARLKAAGLARADAAAALGLDAEQVSDLWKDQREVSAGDVRILAALLAAAPAEVAARAGVSTPVPKDVPADLPEDFAARLTRVERALAEIKALLLELRARP